MRKSCEDGIWRVVGFFYFFISGYFIRFWFVVFRFCVRKFDLVFRVVVNGVVK